MYYDRRIGDELLALLADPRGPLADVLAFVRSPQGEARAAHLELRRSSQDRSRGAVQLYCGGTSPLEVIYGLVGGGRPMLTFRADDFYKRAGRDPELFAVRHAVDDVRAAPFRRVGQEGGVQGRLLRRHGLRAAPGDPFLAIDCEVRFGHAQHADTLAEAERLRRELCLSPTAKIHSELDVVGLLGDGGVALVELKQDTNALRAATEQLVQHVLRFRWLEEAQPTWREQVLPGMRRQKEALGLLPTIDGRFASAGPIVPVIAAPCGADRDWAWASEVARKEAAARTHDLLVGLRLWRLGVDGGVREEAVIG